MSCFPAETSAWHARPRQPYRPRFFVALLVGAAVGLCAPGASGYDGGADPDAGTDGKIARLPDGASDATSALDEHRAAPADARPALVNGGRVYQTVVTAPATAGGMAREDRAAASSVVTQDRTPRAAESVPELLAEQAGGIVTRVGGLGATATLSLRGSSANQVLVYLDGVPLNTPTGGGVDLGAIPLGDVGRIEIYRGTTPIGFGASAIGGVVSLTSLAPKTDGVALEAGGGSFGTRYGAARGAWSRDRLRLYGSARALTSDGDFSYVNSNGTNLDASDDRRETRRNNDLRQLDGMVRAAVDLGPARQMRAQVMFFDRAQGLPGQAALFAPDARLDTRRIAALAAYEAGDAFGPGGRLRGTLYGTYLASRFADPNASINPLPTDTHDRTYTTGATSDGKIVLADWLTIAGVLDARHDRFTPSDGGSTGAPGTRWLGAAGIESDLWVRALRLDVIASLRLEAARDATSGRDQFYTLRDTSTPVHHTVPIARLSLAQNLTPWLALKANGGRYGRLPSLVELYGNTGYLLGNRELSPERGLNADVGAVVTWRGQHAKLDWSSALFASFVDDLISYRMGGGRARAENVASARILGAETSAHVELGAHVRIFVSATLTEARDTTSRPTYAGKRLPMRPRYHVYLRPEWRALRLAHALSLGLYVDLDATAGNFLDPANLRPVERRVLLGAGAYASLPAGFCLRLSGRNLADSPVYDLANYPLPGREVYLTLAWSSAQPQAKD